MAFPETRAPRRMTVLATALATAALAVTSIGVAAQDDATMRSNYSDPVPKPAMQDMMDYCAEQTGCPSASTRSSTRTTRTASARRSRPGLKTS